MSMKHHLKMSLQYLWIVVIVGFHVATACSKNQIQCRTNSRCISYNNLCDGRNDCYDNSDEGCRSGNYWNPSHSRAHKVREMGLSFTSYIFECTDSNMKYTGSIPYCEIRDHCLSNPCSMVCTTQSKGYQCACYQGYTLADDGKTCNDIDECVSNPCSDVCINTPGSFQCLCPLGYEIKNKTICTDIDECLSSPCSQHCANSAGAYECSCGDGYYLSDNMHLCLDVDECQNDTLHNCEQVCVNHESNFSCSCLSGFKLQDDGFSCNDIDECDIIPRVCSQKCTNSIGSYKCWCLPGFKLHSSSCTQENGHVKVYFSTKNNIYVDIMTFSRIYNVSMNNTSILSNLIYMDEELVWLETYSVGGAIKVLNLNMQNISKVINIDGGSPESMALDTRNFKIYVTDSDQNAVRVYELKNTTSSYVQLRGIMDFPTSIALDTSKGIMYYINSGSRRPGIYKAAMDGSSSSPFVYRNVRNPKQIELDLTSDVLYWVDSGRDVLEMISLDGRSRKTLLPNDQHPKIAGPISLAVFEDTIFWSEQNKTQVFLANKRNVTEVSTIDSPDINSTINSISSGKSETHYEVLDNPCANKTCSQMCLLAQNDTATCVCFKGFQMNVQTMECVRNKSVSDQSVFMMSPRQMDLSKSWSKEEIDINQVKANAETRLLKMLLDRTDTLVSQLERYGNEKVE